MNAPTRYQLYPAQRPLVALGLVLLFGAILRFAFHGDQVLLQSVLTAHDAHIVGEGFGYVLRDGIESSPALAAATNGDKILIIAVGLVYRFLGVSAFTSAIIPASISLLTALTLWAIGKHTVNEITGLLAAFLWLILPIGIFSSTQLLSVHFYLLLNLLAVHFYLRAKSGTKKAYFLWAAAIIAIGLWLHWTYALATAAFLLINFIGNTWPNLLAKRILVASLVLTPLAYVYVSQSGTQALDLLHLSRMIEENLIFLPLLVLAGVSVSMTQADEKIKFLVHLFATKLAFFFAISEWIAADPILLTLGTSSYWLDVITPGLLLISWALSSKLGEAYTQKLLIAISIIGSFVVLGLHSSAGLLTISRISFGLTLLGYACVIALWNSEQSQSIRTAVSGLVVLLVLGSFAITDLYWQSYSHLSRNTSQMLQSLPAGSQATLYGEGEIVFPMLSYQAGFDDSVQVGNTTVTLMILSDVETDEIPSGSYVAMTTLHRDFIFGLPPTNWKQIQQIGEGETELLVFHVEN